MFFIEFSRVVKFALQSILRNFWLSLVTVSIITLALFSVSFLFIFNLMSAHTLAVVEGKTNVYIDLTASATPEQAQLLVAELQKLPAIKEAEFITPEKTLEDFKARHQDNKLILQSLASLEQNPFRGSLRINVYNISDFPVILSELSKKDYGQYLEIEDQEFTDAKLLIQGIGDYSQKIQRGGLIISLFFIIISLLVVFNTIQVGIYTHREEIGIMKLVGASNSFVRSPFLIEGIVYSILAVAILMAVLYPLLAFIQPYIDGFFKEYSTSLITLLNQNFFRVFGIQFLIAVVITVLSGFFAVRRYIKV
ncbi:MAG: permease-like cell division protein FtsX [Candidatus Komeilibacteria bacterium]|nr:permease-like cell division protein FtsX [Candidatus Komeilibacteria bacterium]